MPNIGPLELLVILAIALLIFGPKNLPKLGKSLGQTVKNVREGMEGDDEEPAKAIADKAVAEAPEVAEDASEVVEEDVQFCSKCGAKNAADAGFCNKCGAKLG